jgi:hypothetical protein
MPTSNKCFYCGKYYREEQKAKDCARTHDIVYVPIMREDLNRLINYIATGDSNLLTERLSRTLFRYVRAESAWK